MSLYQHLTQRWQASSHPFLIQDDVELYFDDLATAMTTDLSMVKAGDVVALIGDFDVSSIATLIRLIDKAAIIVPLTSQTHVQHQYFFEAALVDFVIENGQIQHRTHSQGHELINQLKRAEKPGLVLFSTGTTGNPKAILHDFSVFLQRFNTPRPTLATLSFLLFDHIGGLNTLFHTLFNQGTVIATKERTVAQVLSICRQHQVQVLPTTPTFLRMMLMSGLIPEQFPESLTIITYGTERMDQPTLDAISQALPNVDFRQTFGMSELGILRVKSQARDSLWMKVGGEGVETRVLDQVLHIRSTTRMLGYLNAPSPFDEAGWYNTKDLVEQQGEYIKVIGRATEVINVGGLKFMASQVEQVALDYPGVELVKVVAKNNPITGQHIELTVQASENEGFDLTPYKTYLQNHLPKHMQPAKTRIGQVSVGHRFKKV